MTALKAERDDAQLWTALFTFPLLAAIQETCARIALQYVQAFARLLERA